MFETIISIAAVTFTTLLAGVFLAYSVSIVAALRKLGDVEYLRMMQANDRAIRNPIFFLIFTAPVVLLPIAAYITYGENSFVPWLIAATTYLIGPLGMTSGGNEPLNQKIVHYKVAASTAEAQASFRRSVEEPWNRLHTWRTVLAVISALFAVIALAVR